MRSPFPGMDPYMERRWGTIHGRLIIYTADDLNVRLAGTGLRADSEQRLIVEVDGRRARDIEPDVFASGTPRPQANGSAGGTAVAAAPSSAARPICIVDDEPITQRFVEVRDARNGGEVVTVIEFVSPTNKKPGDGRRQFQRKRHECFKAGVNFVEIDLTREGRRVLPDPAASVSQAREAAYVAVVRRFNPERRWEIYPMPLREPLQPVALPLREGDADLVLQLQPLIDRAHAAAAFEPFDYAGELHPPLSPEDAAWAAERLARGLTA